MNHSRTINPLAQTFIPAIATEAGSSLVAKMSPPQSDATSYGASYSNSKKSVKYLTCYYWSHGGCRKSDAECLYSHFDTGHHADKPRAIQPGGPAVAGKNLQSALIQKEPNWRDASPQGHSSSETIPPQEKAFPTPANNVYNSARQNLLQAGGQSVAFSKSNVATFGTRAEGSGFPLSVSTSVKASVDPEKLSCCRKIGKQPQSLKELVETSEPDTPSLFTPTCAPFGFGVGHFPRNMFQIGTETDFGPAQNIFGNIVAPNSATNYLPGHYQTDDRPQIAEDASVFDSYPAKYQHTTPPSSKTSLSRSLTPQKSRGYERRLTVGAGRPSISPAKERQDVKIHTFEGNSVSPHESKDQSLKFTEGLTKLVEGLLESRMKLSEYNEKVEENKPEDLVDLQKMLDDLYFKGHQLSKIASGGLNGENAN